MKNILLAFAPVLSLLVALLAPLSSFAEAVVIEGDEAVTRYQRDKATAKLLVQKGREFILRTPDGKEAVKPPGMSVKVGEWFYISNEEDEFVHNVYDVTDSSWVLKKQHPSTIAAISFNKPGEHRLRCAIHPFMKMDIEVVP